MMLWPDTGDAGVVKNVGVIVVAPPTVTGDA